MGFNLRQKLEETFADINPFDNGATAQTVRANRAKAAPAQTVKTQTQNRPMFQQNNQPAFTQQKQFKIQTQSPTINVNNSMPKVQTFGQSSDPLKVGQVKSPQLVPAQPAKPVQYTAPTQPSAPKVYTPQAQQAYVDAKIIGTGRPDEVKQAITRTVDRKNSVRLEPQFKQGKSYEDIARDGGFSIDEVKRYAERNHKGYGDQGLLGNAARAIGQFVGGMVKNGTNIVARPFTDLGDMDRNKGEAELQQINRDYRSGNITPAAAMERANTLAGRYTTQKATFGDDGYIRIGSQTPVEFAGNVAQQGIDSASLLPVAGGAASGSARIASALGNKTAANTLNKAASVMTAGAQTQATSKLANALTARGMNPQTANLVGNAITSNAKQSLVYGSAQTGADVASGRGITPESLAMNYGADFLMGAVPEIGLGSVGRGIDLNNTKVHQELVRTNPTYKANTDKLMGIDATIARAQANGDVRALEGLQAVRAQLSDSNALIARRYAEQGFLGGKNATGFKDAEARGEVFDGVDGLPRFEVDDSGAKLNDKEFSWGIKMDGKPRKVGQILEHDKLFEQYPELKDVNVRYEPNDLPGHDAHFDPDTNTIVITKSRADKSHLSDIIHELQHTIQGKEGFAGGGAPEYRNYKAENASIKRGLQDVNTTLSGKNLTPEQTQRLRAKRDNLIKQLEQTQDQYGNVFTKAKDIADYRKLAGEAEARAVQARMDMPMSERYVKDGADLYHGTTDEAFKLDKKKHLFLTGDKDDAGTYGTPQKFGAKNGKTLDLNDDATKQAYVRDALGKQDPELKKYFDELPDSVRDQFDFLDWLDDQRANGRTFTKEEVRKYEAALSQYKRITRRDVYDNWDKIIAKAKKDGYDYIKHETEDPSASYTFPETIAINPEKSLVKGGIKPRSTFYDSLDVPKEDLIIRNGDGKAMSIDDPTAALKQEALKYKSADEFLQAKADEGGKLSDTLEPFGKRTPEQADLENLHAAVNLYDNLPDQKAAIKKYTDLYNQAHTQPTPKVEAPQVTKTPKQPTAFEQDLKKAGLGVEPDAYRKQPQDVKKAIDAHIANENPQLAYTLDSTIHFPDGIPKVRPEDVKAISGLTPREAGIPPIYVSRNAPPIDELAVDYETTVRGNTTGELKMTSEDFLDTMMDAIEANRSVGQQTKLIRELRNNPDVIAKAKATLEAERAQYGAPEVVEPSKRDLRDYAKMATPGTASTARQSARSRQQKPGLSTNPQPDLPQSKQLSSLQQKLGSAEPTPDSPVNESITSLDSTTKPQVNQVKVKQAGREKNVPVMKQTRDGDVITATNVNDKIKVGEKRYSVDEDGKLIEDKKGATSLFTDKEGRVTGFRVGKEYFDAKDLGDLTSVNGYGSTLATMRRNVERAFDKKTGDKVSAFLVDHQQGQATKLIQRQVEMKQGMQSLADDLGINFASGTKRAKKVSAAIQDFGEGKRNRASLVAEYGNQTADKIITADKWFRKNYDTLLDEMNSTLKQFGYDPVPKRANYYTHFQDEGLWQKFGLKMQEIRDLSSPTMQDANPTGGRGSISNKLAGMSENTSPNKAFNKFALQRKGNKHTSDAFKAFELYLNPTLNNIYMTPSISRARVLSRAIAQDADIVGKDANKTIVQIREWANSLAGKSSRIGDRQLADTMAGPNILKALGWAQKKTGQNTIVGNLSTAVMQPIVLAQTAGKFGYKNTLAGLYQQASGALNSAQAQSGFLKRRYTDVTPVTAGKLDRGAKVANKPLEIVEENAVRSTWNAAHNDAVSQGMTGRKAIQYADVQTEKTVAGRSIGERPEVFRAKSAGLATMFQLEVNNFWQQTGKEMNKSQVAKTMVAMYGLNLGLQALTGRQVGFNPIDAAIDSYDEATKERPGEENSALERGKRIGQRWTGEFVDNAPFIGMAANTAFGEEKVKEWTGDNSNTGRFGASSPIRTLLDNPWMAVSPMAGGQIKKTVEAVPVLVEGKLKDKDGNTLVNVPQTPENIAKGLAFGKGAIPEVNQYYDNLGKSKVDQKLVKNQSVSKAGSMSLDGLTKEQQTMLSTAREDMKPSLIEQYRKDNKAGYTAEKSGTKAPAKKSTAKPLPADMSSTAKSILDSYDSMSTEDKKKWDKTTATGNTARTALNNWLGGRAEVPKISNEIARDWANYEKGIKDGTINALEKDTKKKEILRKAFNEQLSDVEKTMYKLSKADIQRYAESGDITEANLNNALAVEKQLFDAGLISKETLANKLGVAARGYKGKTGRKSSGKGRKVAKGKFDYKLNGFGTSNTSNSKQLHDLLKKATMRVSA